MKILITGSSGFVGSALVPVLLSGAYEPISAIRNIQFKPDTRVKSLFVGSIDATTNWSAALQGSDVVIHLAALTHVVCDTTADSLAAFRAINVDGALNLARQAAVSGVKRFLFISSLKAIGELTQRGQAFAESDSPAPQDAYGQSKHDAEQGLRQIASANGMEVIIIRPPTVYGPGVKANFRTLLQLVTKCVPLPLSILDSNCRSFVAVSNLVDLILLCLEHQAAANQTFHVSDDDDISTAELLRRIGKALGKPVRNLPIPEAVLKTGLRLVGKAKLVDKLCGDLRVDISETKHLLGWKPKVTMEEELERTAKWWRESRQGRL